PRQLNAGLSSDQKSIRVFMDVVACAALVPRDDISQDRQQCAADERLVAGGVEIFLRSHEEPESGVDAVVFGLLAGIRKSIRQHAVARALGERKKNATRVVEAMRREAESGQGNH